MGGRRTRAHRVRPPGADRPVPSPSPVRQLLVSVNACGVCRTDLHLAEGDLPPPTGRTSRRVTRSSGPSPPSVPGLKAPAGRSATGPVSPGSAARAAAPAGTAGAGLRTCARAPATPAGTTTAATRSTRRSRPPSPIRLPAGYADAELAPLLCAGIIGYRALARTSLPQGGRLGLYGFGGSAHLAAQVALARGATVHVLTRGDRARRLALELGAASARDAYAEPPEKLDAAILFAPVGELVPVVLRALDRGGVLSIAGIHLTDVPALNYEDALFYEREIRSVTANTRQDGEEFLTLAERLKLKVTTTPYPFSQAADALADLKAGRVDGAAVLQF